MIGHPFNPPCLIPTVELVPNASTSDETIQQAFHFYKDVLGKAPVLVKTELPGFVANRSVFISYFSSSENYYPPDFDCILSPKEGIRSILSRSVLATYQFSFLCCRLQAALVHEAYSLVSRGIVSAEDIGQSFFLSIALLHADRFFSFRFQIRSSRIL